MRLYHYTSANQLAPIGRLGLTVGDVPTDLQRAKGRIGVWLTTADHPVDLGLAGAAVDKARMRLHLEIDVHSLALARWDAWKRKHVEPATIATLERVAGPESDPASWYVYFGWLKPERILDVVDMSTGLELPDWKGGIPGYGAVEAIPYADRHRWHRDLLRKVRMVTRGR